MNPLRDRRVADTQVKLMRAEGFRLCQRKAVSRMPKAFITSDKQWRISTATGGLWKLERFRDYIYIHVHGSSRYVARFDAISHPRFETPLAMALWFNMLRRLENLGVGKL